MLLDTSEGQLYLPPWRPKPVPGATLRRLPPGLAPVLNRFARRMGGMILVWAAILLAIRFQVGMAGWHAAFVIPHAGIILFAAWAVDLVLLTRHERVRLAMPSLAAGQAAGVASLDRYRGAACFGSALALAATLGLDPWLDRLAGVGALTGLFAALVHWFHPVVIGDRLRA